MNFDAPEFRTESSTPISPLPVHPPEPNNITVLRNQIDPVFNMTSTHIGSNETEAPLKSTITANISPVHTDDEAENIDDASFLDTYDEQDASGVGHSAEPTGQNAEVDDDYAMTFDSDGDEDSSRQELSNADADQDLLPQPAPVPVAENGESAVAESAPTIPSESHDNISHDSMSHNLPISSTPAITAGDAPIAIDNDAPAATEISQSQSQASYEGVASGEIDIQQLLDNITATAELNAANSTIATPTSATISSPIYPPGPSGLPLHASLPPRPQVIQKPPIHSAYAAQDDIRKYHAGPPGYPPPPGTYRPPGVPGSIVAAGAPGTSTDPRNSLPPPPSASFNPPPSLSTPPTMSYPAYPPPPQRLFAQDHPTQSIEPADASDDDEVQWAPGVQKLYDEFLADERMYVAEGLWDRFPAGSRLFIGNLPTEKVTKRDLFYCFHKYGRIAQVSIKQAYGFVQFHDVAACYAALDREQGQEVRGRKMHLEISKPQKNTRQANTASAPAPIVVRRSRSPDYSRGGRGGHAPTRSAGYDRYDVRPVVSPRDEYRAPQRARDDYRPVRSPSPSRGGYRGRDEYQQPRGREFYDGRERRRSRSRSPYERRDNGRYRERTLSPRAREADEDSDLQIPRRNARDVPEVQIILMEELDRGFVAWVESEIRGRGVTTEVMLLNPRNSLTAIIRRQILEGVLAVSQLTRRSQDASKIPLQVFDRQGGANNVRFDEYQDLEPRIAGELVLRARQTQTAQAPSSYGQPQFPSGQSYQPPPVAVATPNLASLVGQLDNATLQKLLGTLNSAPQQQAPPAVDLASLLGGLVPQQPPQQQPTYQPQPQAANQYSSQSTSQNLASILGAAAPAQPQAQPQSAQQVQNIMAQLARFRQ